MFRGGVPDLLLVGPVTWDRFGGERRVGGAVTYGARAASAMGVHAGVLTSGANDAPLDAFDGHEVHLVPAEHTRVFIHEPREGRERRLRIEGAKHSTEMRLSATDLPAGWAEAPVALLAPLLPMHLDIPSFRTLGAGRVGLLAQGLQRSVTDAGEVEAVPRPTEALLEACDERVIVFLSSAETAGWEPSDFDTVAERARALVVTRGAEGATVREGAVEQRILPTPSRAIDPTGAGDVFATVFTLAFDEGIERAGRLASVLAAAAAELVGPVPLPPRAEIERRMGVGSDADTTKAACA